MKVSQKKKQKKAYNPCKCIDAFKIKHNFYYKNINN